MKKKMCVCFIYTILICLYILNIRNIKHVVKIVPVKEKGIYGYFGDSHPDTTRQETYNGYYIKLVSGKRWIGETGPCSPPMSKKSYLLFCKALGLAPYRNLGIPIKTEK